MKFRWESEKERLIRFMKISPKAKLEWLRQMNDFTAKLPRQTRKIRSKLRQGR
jgi:hypothetical protein